MRIGTDVRHLASGPTTGVGNVTRALLPALAAVMPNDRLEVFYAGRRRPPDFVSSWAKDFSHCTLVAKRMSNRLFDMLAMNQMLPGEIWKIFASADVYLSTHMLPVPKTRTPRVLVLHDLSFIRHPEFFSPRRRSWHARIRPRLQAERAAAIVVPSYATARDVTDLWSIPEKKIHVIPWGTPAAEPGSRLLTEQPKSGRAILFLGTVEKRKNVVGLLRAFFILKHLPGSADVRLILAGDHGWGSAAAIAYLRTQPEELQRSVTLSGYVTETEKRSLLAQADVLVYPSLYEGSGLPVLEAMAAGVPCVVSGRTALPEIAGSAALLTDPDRPEELVSAIRSILDHRAFADVLRSRGRERAAQFTWEKTALAVADVLRSVS